MYLKVGVPPTFTGNNNGNHVIINTPVGKNVTLSCEAAGNPMPVIYWYMKKTLIATGAHLHLANISEFAHSEYECVARNNILPDPSRKFKINVRCKLFYYFFDCFVFYRAIYFKLATFFYYKCNVILWKSRQLTGPLFSELNSLQDRWKFIFLVRIAHHLP